MKTLKAIIIDDEASARENLELLLQRFCLQIKVLGSFKGLEQGVHYLKSNEVDVVFLDVDMPNFAGYEIVDFIDPIPFQIIFTTAHDQFALKAFEISAIDYLVKPLEVERLKEAVKKVETKKATEELAQKYDEVATLFQQEKEPKLGILHQGRRVFVPFKDIIAVQADGAYSTVYTQSGEAYVYSKNISSLEKYFEGFPLIFRSHKSWLVNTTHIEEYLSKRNILSLKNGIEARLSRYKVGEFKALIQ